MAFCERFEEGPAISPYTVLAPVGTGLTYGAILLERDGGGDEVESAHPTAAVDGASSATLSP